MPNVSAIEPQVLLDLLALSLLESESGNRGVSRTEIAVVSPWLSDVELALHPSGRHGCLGGTPALSSLRLGECLRAFRDKNWGVRVGVLKYGQSSGGLRKDPTQFSHERGLLRGLLAVGADVYLCPNLHAKGVVTPLGVITGTTNYTHSGVHMQMQNANYFAYDHPEYEGNRVTLLAYLHAEYRVSVIG
jgi:hypothetical protein